MHSLFMILGSIVIYVINLYCHLLQATHDTWNTSQLQQLVMRGERESLTTGVRETNPLGSPTVNLPSRDTLIIHDDPS